MLRVARKLSLKIKVACRATSLETHTTIGGKSGPDRLAYRAGVHERDVLSRTTPISMNSCMQTSKPASQQASKPASQQASKQASKPASRQASQQASNSAMQPCSHAAIQPSCRPAIQPSNQQARWARRQTTGRASSHTNTTVDTDTGTVTLCNFATAPWWRPRPPPPRRQASWQGVGAIATNVADSCIAPTGLGGTLLSGSRFRPPRIICAKLGFST